MDKHDLNKERVELGDIDIDLCPSKRPLIIQKIKEERGKNFKEDINELSRENLGCTLIATFKTETTKSAIMTACRGYRSEECPEGIDNNIAQYLSSLIPSERGFLWPLDDVINGNPEKDRVPVTVFLKEISAYPGLLDAMKGIEGIISARGSHASGIILFDEDPYEFGCFMRTPSGDVITQYDLHTAEAAGMTKYDFLLTENQDKIAQTIQFLQEAGEIEDNLSLKQVYDKYFHPDIIPINDKTTWEKIQNGEILNIFQFDSDVGSQAIKKIKPKNILELADANGLMRLMTAEKGAETPMEKYVRFKNDLSQWYMEMSQAGLTKKEVEIIEPYFKDSYGVPPSQEQLMKMLMDKDICNFSLKDANAARKIVGKKQMSKIPGLRKQVLEQATSPALGEYVWRCGIGPQMGYSFSIIHALAYSFIGFQNAYLATRWNPIYWNTACLVVNSASLEAAEDDEDKKEKSANYGKIAKAIGEIVSQGIKISLVNINSSDYGFKPDVENNRILYGLKPLSSVNAEAIELIKAGRPYTGIKDFMNRCPLGIKPMLSLIKSGAFDEVESVLSNRKEIMVYYLLVRSKPKTNLNLQNFNGLIQGGFVPKELELQVRVYNFTKHIKTTRKVGQYFTFGDIEISFIEKFLPEILDQIETINGVFCISQKAWDKIYQSQMDIAREWLKNNQEEILRAYNFALFKNEWEKYAKGTLSYWEMEALCFYYHPHELSDIKVQKYGIVNFFNLPETPVVDYFFRKTIPVYKLQRIAGTVIDKDDVRSSVTLLTLDGVVNVKFTKEYYAMFNRQISEIQTDGTKKVKEKSWFTRGTKIIVSGFRREDTFVGKTYKNTPFHQLYKITEIKDGELTLCHERYQIEEAPNE